MENGFFFDVTFHECRTACSIAQLQRTGLLHSGYQNTANFELPRNIVRNFLLSA